MGKIMSSSGGRLLRLWILVTLAIAIDASTPNIILSINGVDQTWLAKRALFGSDMKRLEGLLVHSPSQDELLCEYSRDDRNSTMTPLQHDDTWVMMVPRGGCTYEKKAYAAKTIYGASGVLIYDNLSARYQWDNETQKLTYPEEKWDYECDFGYGFVDNIELDPPGYSREALDPIMDQRLNTTRCTFEPSREPCESQLCLVTGPPALNTTKFPVCCAWDLPLTMTGDDSAGDTDDILAVFLTIRQGQEFMSYVGKTVVVEARPHQPFNPSMIFLWMLAVSIAFVAAYYGASDFRIFRLTLAQYQAAKNARNASSSPREPNNDEEKPQETQTEEDDDDDDDDGLDDLVVDLDDLSSQDDADDEGTPGDDSLDGPIDDKHEDEPEQEEEPPPSNTKQNKKWALRSLPPNDDKTKKKRDEVWVLHSIPPPERKPKAKRKRPGYKAEHTAETDILPTDGGKPLPEPWAAPIGGFEMTQWHVLGFLVLASAMLFLLFYFRFYQIIFIFYGFGCAGAVSLLIFGPILVRLVPKLGHGVVQELNKSVVCGLNGFDITSQLMGYIWAIVWIWFGLTHYRPSTNAFFWISIDVFGACFCILALSMMKLNSIMIASLLLVAVFCYDIFFVFLTPLFMDGQSVMITVAKGGGGDSTADDFCYRYPDDNDCTGIDFLPMLLIVPRMNDYMNGSVLLGLGDIVLPGYLIVFCARLDEAKLILGKHTKTEIDYPNVWYKRYFVWIMVAYGLGLIFAFLAYCLTGMGQPALLYLVPCCLGTIIILGRNEFRELWKGSRAIRLATKVKTKHERAWGKEKMRREVEVAKQKRARGEQQQPYRASRSGFREPDPPVVSDSGTRDRDPPGGRSDRDGGRGRGRGRGRSSGRGRGGRTSGRGRGQGLENQKSFQRPKNNPGSQQASLEREPTESTISSTLNSSTEAKSKSTKSASPSPGSPRRRYTATLDGNPSPSPRKSSSRKESAQRSLPPKPDLDGPRSNDVCFGDKNSTGVKHLRTVVKHELKRNAMSEFSPSVLQGVFQKLDGRKFFVSDGKDGWREASVNETSKEISKVYRGERSKLQANESKSKGEGNEA